MTFSFTILLLFFIYMTFYIMLPGMLISDLLLSRRFSFSVRLLSSFFLGFVVVAFLYYIECVLGIPRFITVVPPLLSVIWFVKWIKQGRKSLFNENEDFKWIYLILFIFIYVASFLSFQLKYLGALSGETTQVFHDYLFHTGNIASLSRSFPNSDIRVLGLPFYYHYFYELVFAMCKHIFGMDAFSLYMNGNALVCAFPLTMALITLGDRIRGDREVTKFTYVLYLTGLLVSCICLLPLNVVGGTFPISWMDNHLFTNGNAMGLALSLTILLVEIIASSWNERYSNRMTVALFLLTVAATGFKGTTGALAVAITWAVFIIELIITRKFAKAKLIYAITMALAFAFTYACITVGIGSSGANNRSTTLSLSGTLEASRVCQILTKLGIDYTILPITIIAIILCAICIVGPMILPFVCFVYGKIKILIKEKEIGDIYDWFAIGSSIMGIVGFCIVTVPGLSQVYFVITNAPLIFYCAMKYVSANNKKLVAYITYLFLGVGTAFLVIDLGYYCYSAKSQNEIYSTDAGDQQDLVSAEIMDAYLWLKENTPEDSIIAVDRFTEGLDYRNIYFYCSAFSERQVFLEGYDYSDISEESIEAMLSINEKFFSEDKLEACTALDISGVDYLVVTESVHPDYETTCEYMELVFENEQVKIYKHTAKDEGKDRLSVSR